MLCCGSNKEKERQDNIYTSILCLFNYQNVPQIIFGTSIWWAYPGLVQLHVFKHTNNLKKVAKDNNNVLLSCNKMEEPFFFCTVTHRFMNWKCFEHFNRWVTRRLFQRYFSNGALMQYVSFPCQFSHFGSPKWYIWQGPQWRFFLLLVLPSLQEVLMCNAWHYNYLFIKFISHWDFCILHLAAFCHAPGASQTSGAKNLHTADTLSLLRYCWEGPRKFKTHVLCHPPQKHFWEQLSRHTQHPDTGGAILKQVK